MIKQFFAIACCVTIISYANQATAQSSKNKKSRYYQNSNPEPEFNVNGFFRENEKNEVDEKPKEAEYDVKIRQNEKESKYHDEQRVRDDERAAAREAAKAEREAARAARDAEREAIRAEREENRRKAYPTTYGGYRTYNENRAGYDKYYGGNSVPPPPPPPVAEPLLEEPQPARPVTRRPARVRKVTRKEKEIKMTSQEAEYQTTVVKKRYTNLDVLCDDLDLAKIQRPVFKGICSECSRDVDLIIVNKNMSSLEKNYNLKQCYMMRDKRLRETLDDAQYKKWLRIKDADEYLILTKDTELKDGVNK